MYRDGDQNYKCYSDAELQQALEGISSKNYPINFKNLIAEMSLRGIYTEKSSEKVAVPDKLTFMQRPKSVEIAVYILYGTLIIGILQYVFGPTLALYGAVSKMVFGILLFGWILKVILLDNIWDGSNWARIIMAIFSVYGLLGAVGMLFTGQYPSLSHVQLTLSIVTYTANIIAIVLLFVSKSAPWFKHK